jgi:LacI family transcriptional regulator
VNNRRAFQRATEFLLDLGHRRIGAGQRPWNSWISRSAAAPDISDALTARGIAPTRR